MRLFGAILLSPVLLMLIAAGARAQDIRVTPLAPGATLSTFDRAQWSVDPGCKYKNPFDPQEVSIDAVFIAPGGRTLNLPAFWDESGNFVLRFAPDEPGAWSFKVTATDSAGTRTAAGPTFQVAAGHSHGFIRRADNNRYFRFDSGQSYFPVGINLAWAPGDETAQWFDQSFKTMADNGANFARIWMCHPPVMLESVRTGLGRYSLPNAAMFDGMLEAAERHNIGVMLTFVNHRELLESDRWGTGGWEVDLAYNAKNGGPATRPADFFTNPDSRRHFKGRLRYIVARYCAFTSVGFWELMNEQEYARVPVPNDWNAEMSAYIRQLDPFKHLITTSANVPPQVWQLPDIDVTQSHIYGDGTQVDVIAPIESAFRDHEQFNKPHLVAELGTSYKENDSRFDPTGKGTTFHNGLWSAMTSGSAGTGMYWWWDNYIGPKNLWHEFKPIAALTSQVDWAHRQFAPTALQGPWRDGAGDTFADLTIYPSGGWGATSRVPVVVPPNGRPDVSIPGYIYGPRHPDLRSPLIFQIDLPCPSDLILHIGRASDFVMLRVSVDEKPVADFGFSALPASGDVQNPELQGEFYQGDVNKDRRISIPAGKHAVKLDAIAGDWVTVSGMTFTSAVPAKFANLASIAVQDPATHETIAWLWDTRSNWKDDQAHDSSPAQEHLHLGIPNIDNGSFTAQWWDTRTGQIVRTDHAAPTGGALILDVPTFTRDIALRLTPTAPN